MKQISFSEAEELGKRRRTRRERFLEEMEKSLPWAELEREVKRHYPKGKRGRRPYAAGQMLRVYFMQQWYDLSDPGMEDALYEIASMRRFAGFSLSRGTIPDETTILKFRHYLEQHDLGPKLLAVVNEMLVSKGMLLRQGTIVDATLIDAPSSTKNEERKRDPEMHQTRKGNQWYFGMKSHIGVDETSGLVHSVVSTAANVHDLTVAADLLHGDEQRVFADAGYRGIDKRAEHRERSVEWYIARRPGERKKLRETLHGKLVEEVEYKKASLRAKVEHPFRVIKRQFKLRKVRYRGLSKNHHRLTVLYALSNIYQCRRMLMAT